MYSIGMFGSDWQIELISEMKSLLNFWGIYFLQLSRVKAVESEMEQLEKPMKEAQEFLKLENEITKKKNMLYQVYV